MRVHGKDGERQDLREAGEKSKKSHFRCCRGTGEALRKMSGGKNIISLMLDYELDPRLPFFGKLQ